MRMSLTDSWLFLLIVFSVSCAHTVYVTAAPSTSALQDECGHTLQRPSGNWFRRHFDVAFLKKFFKHWIPFTNSARVKMQFFLYKSDFADCGRELFTDEDEILRLSGFNASHPTRIIIHGWMSQSKGSFNRAVKNAYLSLTKPRASAKKVNGSLAATTTTTAATTTPATNAPTISLGDDDDDDDDDEDNHDNSNNYNNGNKSSNAHVDYNVIVCDWSLISSNVNYFGVVELTEDLGFLLAEFVRHLHMRAGLQFNDVYLIGHSLGAQIAGSAGKQIKPFRFNTIYALDPAGPKFRDSSDDFRIDSSDAEYVESIQTSSSLGFEKPVGHAAFYPNFGKDQKKCYIYGCSHSRAYDYFAESITSEKGFWGTLCERQGSDIWILADSEKEYRMGGEPSVPKVGTFYVKTNDKPPYALGRRRRVASAPLHVEEIVEAATMSAGYDAHEELLQGATEVARH